MPKPIGAGKLFVKDAHGTFMDLTRSRYDAMMTRLIKKKLMVKDQPPFTCDQYRHHVLAALNNKEDGYIQCRYCHGYYGIKDVASDHANPLDEGGSVALDNIEFPCKQCNLQKGKMNPGEFLLFLDLLVKHLPRARIDILARLAQSVQLAAGQRNMAPVVNALKESGEWEKVQRARLQEKRDKKAGLGTF